MRYSYPKAAVLNLLGSVTLLNSAVLAAYMRRLNTKVIIIKVINNMELTTRIQLHLSSLKTSLVVVSFIPLESFYKTFCVALYLIRVSPALILSSSILMVQNISHAPVSVCSFFNASSILITLVPCNPFPLHYITEFWVAVFSRCKDKKGDTLIKMLCHVVWCRNMVFLCAQVTSCENHCPGGLRATYTSVFTKHSLCAESDIWGMVENDNRCFKWCLPSKT